MILLDAVRLAMVITALVALVDAVQRPAVAFVVHNKLTKPIWLGILVASLLVGGYFGILSLIGPFALVASIVYLVDVKPALTGSR